jgi:hypothetical protein
LIHGFPGADSTGSFDAYRAAKEAGVSAPIEAILVGFIGNQGKVSFSENWYGCGFRPSGTHRTFLGNPRRPIESVETCKLKFPESILAYERRAYFGKNKTVIVKKWQKTALLQMGSGGLAHKHPNCSDVTHHTFFARINASSSSWQ